jgi:hypothetical protein
MLPKTKLPAWFVSVRMCVLVCVCVVSLLLLIQSLIGRAHAVIKHHVILARGGISTQIQLYHNTITPYLVWPLAFFFRSMETGV